MSGVGEYDAAYRAYLEARGAPARGWSEAMAGLFRRANRLDLAAHYTSKGADLS